MKLTEICRRLQPWQVVSRQVVLECLPWLSLWRESIRLPNGREIDDYYQVEERDYVVIVPWQNGRVLGLWRYKHGPRRVNLGFPAGYRENGEDAFAAAQRELREEAGLASAHWRRIGSYCVDGNRSQTCAHIFVAHDCCSVQPTVSDDLEEQIGEWLTPKQWHDYLAAGEVATLGAAMAVHAGVLAFSNNPQAIERSKRGERD
jgi:ADP-ribose pyrophosphatase